MSNGINFSSLRDFAVYGDTKHSFCGACKRHFEGIESLSKNFLRSLAMWYELCFTFCMTGR